MPTQAEKIGALSIISGLMGLQDQQQKAHMMQPVAQEAARRYMGLGTPGAQQMGQLWLTRPDQAARISEMQYGGMEEAFRSFQGQALQERMIGMLERASGGERFTLPQTLEEVSSLTAGDSPESTLNLAQDLFGSLQDPEGAKNELELLKLRADTSRSISQADVQLQTADEQVRAAELGNISTAEQIRNTRFQRVQPKIDFVDAVDPQTGRPVRRRVTTYTDDQIAERQARGLPVEGATPAPEGAPEQTETGLAAFEQAPTFSEIESMWKNYATGTQAFKQAELATERFFSQFDEAMAGSPAALDFLIRMEEKTIDPGAIIRGDDLRTRAEMDGKMERLRTTLAALRGGKRPISPETGYELAQIMRDIYNTAAKAQRGRATDMDETIRVSPFGERWGARVKSEGSGVTEDLEARMEEAFAKHADKARGFDPNAAAQQPGSAEAYPGVTPAQLERLREMGLIQ